MLLVAPLRPDHRLPLDGQAASAQGLGKLKVTRSTVPAITHVDCSARIQTVDAERHGLFHRLLQTFEARTGSPLMINTSFNIRGEPVVCRPEEAHQCFLGTDMDVLVLGRAILKKDAQPAASHVSREDYLAQFALD
jgi:carbamoyltransferase